MFFFKTASNLLNVFSVFFEKHWHFFQPSDTYICVWSPIYKSVKIEVKSSVIQFQDIFSKRCFQVTIICWPTWTLAKFDFLIIDPQLHCFHVPCVLSCTCFCVVFWLIRFRRCGCSWRTFLICFFCYVSLACQRFWALWLYLQVSVASVNGGLFIFQLLGHLHRAMTYTFRIGSEV